MNNVTDFEGCHRGQRAYILGNGSSLSDIDLTSLTDGAVFGTNRIYLKNYVPEYYVCVNPLVLSQFKDEIAQLNCVKFLSNTNGVDLAGFDAKGKVYPLDTSCRIPKFGPPDEVMWEGFTVTYVAMQIAFYMGFKEVYLLGLDHDYGKTYQPNIEVMGSDDDQAHFSSEYFGPGVRWHAPDLANSEIAYSLARAAFGKAGKKIVNASTRTKLRVFPLEKLHQQYRVSAIVSAYKCEKFLEGCLEDLEDQTEDCEIIVVCQEGSKEYDIALAHDPHKIITTKDIPTVYAAWNIGAKAAHGKYLTNANSDDRHSPFAYKIMADILDGRPDIDLVYHDQYVTWKPNQSFASFVDENDGKELVSGRWQGKPGYLNWSDYELKTIRQGCYIGPQPMWRASLHQLHGYFDESFISAGDYEFWLRIAEERNFLHIPQFLGLYLARPDGIELGNPVISSEESTNALYLRNSAKDLNLEHLGGNFYRLDLGNEFISIVGDQVKGMAKYVEEQEALDAAVRLPMPEQA